MVVNFDMPGKKTVGFPALAGACSRLCFLVHNVVGCFGFSGTSLRRTPLQPTKLSIIERVFSGQGFIIHYVGYIWDSV